MSNEVSMIIGTNKLAGWKSVSVNRSMDTISSSFSCTMVDVWEGDARPLIIPGLPCSIRIDDTKVLTGYIDTVAITSGVDDHIITITGRDKTCDLVDCSAINEPGSWKNIGVQRLVYDLVQPFGLRVGTEIALGDAVKSFTLNSGESPFSAIQRICQNKAILPLSDVNGDVLLTTSGQNRSVDKLVLGQNVKESKIDYNSVDRFSKYIVKSQVSGDGESWDRTMIEIYGEATDSAVERYRPLIISAGSQLTNALAQKRASWEAQTRAGRSGKLVVTIPTWLQSNKSLWDINTLVSCDIPTFRIDNETLLLHEIEYKQDENGTVSTLHLIRKDSYAAEPPKQVKTTTKSKSYGYGW